MFGVKRWIEKEYHKFSYMHPSKNKKNQSCIHTCIL